MENLRVADYISTNPDICHGKPCFKGTRIMVSTILELLEAEQTTEQILEGYPGITPRHVQAALHFAAEAVERTKVTPASR